MLKHSGVRTIPNIRVVVVAFVARQAQRLQTKVQIIQILRQLLSPPRGMQPGLLMRRSGRWGAASFSKALFKASGLKGAEEFAHCG
ncbi:hypothetical protein HPC62_12025 [Thermoleptolyngbya sichuanensis A183]|uniref:Uncharacterized protein n=1 Tax=Thermoleptolyngbya sichuanensis A183 TaxID=2737172 RepID=A0A6M8B8L4_9CYAN|nr:MULTISPECIES: hypothetical protein [Thermoleptolyngbya]MDG2617891.1 hypothetical protein [Thermoleptolyngbya sichuanensis XZ-Cy5]QKD82818.1 hypothetical protein HPC62_12025 [Thermoleptolyngbya sichuanensis A183]